MVLLLLQTLDTKQVYTEDELQRFEAEFRDKEEELRRKKEKLREEQELLQERGRALEAQRREYQQVTHGRPLHSFIHSFILCSGRGLQQSHRGNGDSRPSHRRFRLNPDWSPGPPQSACCP